MLDELAEANTELVTELNTLDDLELAKLEDMALTMLEAETVTTLDVELTLTATTDEFAERLTEDTDDVELAEIETALALVVDTELK